MDKNELKEICKQKLPTVTTFSPRDSLNELSFPLGLPKEFFLLLRQYQEEMLDAFNVHFSCEEKRNQRDIHLTKPSLYGRMYLKNAETAIFQNSLR